MSDTPEQRLEEIRQQIRKMQWAGFGSSYKEAAFLLDLVDTQAKQVPEWQPIETARKADISKPILACSMSPLRDWFGSERIGGYAEPPEATYWNDAGCWTAVQRPHDEWNPTHWMELPAPPVIPEESL